MNKTTDVVSVPVQSLEKSKSTTEVTLKFRLYPSLKQREFLIGQFAANRLVYNKAIKIWVHFNVKKGKHLTFENDIFPLLEIAKESRKYGWLKRYDRDTLISALKQAEDAIRAFLMGEKWFPRYKSFQNSQSSSHKSVVVEDGRICIPKLGWIQAVTHLRVKGEIKEITIVRDWVDHYYAYVHCGYPQPSNTISQDKIVGIFHSFYDCIVINNGERIQVPNHLWKEIKYFKKLLKNLTRKQANSANYEEALEKIAKTRQKIELLLSRFLESVAKDLVSKYDAIIVESQKAKKEIVVKKPQYFAYLLLEAAWGEFVDLLSLECKKKGKHLFKVDKDYPSPQICSFCGFVNKDIKPRHKGWTCPQCQTVLENDLNAAINIKNKGILELKAAGITIKKAQQ